MHEDKLDKLAVEMRSELKSVYSSITYISKKMVAFKVNMDVLIESVKKLNDYSHERIHYLLNTDKGVELQLKGLSDKIDGLEKFKEKQLESAAKWRFKFADFLFKTLSGIFFIIIGIVIKSHLGK